MAKHAPFPRRFKVAEGRMQRARCARVRRVAILDRNGSFSRLVPSAQGENKWELCLRASKALRAKQMLRVDVCSCAWQAPFLHRARARAPGPGLGRARAQTQARPGPRALTRAGARPGRARARAGRKEIYFGRIINEPRVHKL